MEISSLKNPENFQSLQHLGYLNPCNLKYLQYQSRHKTQRLIPLTEEIEKAMINFNVSESSTSISNRFIFNTMSVMSLVRGEVCNILQKLPDSDHISREEINDIIKKSLKDCDTNLQHVIIHNGNDELEITVKDITEDRDKTMLFVESIQNLKSRMTKLEKRLKFLLQNATKLRSMQAKKLKVNISAIKNKRNSLKKSQAQIERESLKNNNKNDEEITYNIYDDLFYTTREYTFNLLNYKKSLESLELNKHSKWNPYVKPAHDFLLTPQEGNLKKCPMFLS